MRVGAWRWRGKARVWAVRGYGWRGIGKKTEDGAEAEDGARSVRGVWGE